VPVFFFARGPGFFLITERLWLRLYTGTGGWWVRFGEKR